MNIKTTLQTKTSVLENFFSDDPEAILQTKLSVVENLFSFYKIIQTNTKKEQKRTIAG